MKTTSTRIRLSNPAAVLDMLRHHMAEHDVAVRQVDNVTVAALPGGEARLWIETEFLLADAQALTQSQLEDFTRFLAAHVLEFAHPETPRIEWAGLKSGETFADFREIEVTGMRDLTGHMRRISFKGDDLVRFDSENDLHVRLFFPPPGREPLWPVRGTDGLVQPIPPERQPAVRKYTIRSIDSTAGTLDIDFVLHEISGPGSDWAKLALPGARIGMAGPGGRSARPADWLLLAGDETALPAMARILEALPDTTRGVAIIAVQDASDEVALRHPPEVQVNWLHRISTSSGFVSAVTAVDIPEDVPRFCWAGAEFDDIQAIRRHWRDQVGLAKDEQLAVAYWRAGTQNF